MKKFISLVLAVIFFILVHEGLHALMALIFNEYKAFCVHSFGFEIFYKTPVAERAGIKWGYISGASNVVTLFIGYTLFFLRKVLCGIGSTFFRHLGYWLIFMFMLLDAANLSIVPFIFGGDINGIVQGFGINRYLVQFIFFTVLLVNRELIVQKLFPLYDIKTNHFLFQPLFR